MELKGGFYEDGVQRVGVHEESLNLSHLLSRLKLGPNIPKIFLKNTSLMQNEKIAAQLALQPLRSMPSFCTGSCEECHST